MSGQPVILRNWSVISAGNPYMAPELHSVCLHGVADNHPDFAPDTEITTSPIVGADGRVITTWSRQYVLEGPPAQQYAAHLERSGIALDEKQPVRLHKPSRA